MESISKEDLKKRLEAKRAQLKGLDEELEKARNRELQMKQLQIDLTLEKREVMGRIGELEELVGEKKDVEPKQ
jgi:hypothetical protein